MTFNDESLTCQDCQQKFIWTVGEQQFFHDKGFTRPPIRCPECRKKKKEKHGQKQTPTKIPEGKKYEIRCKKCTKITQVPFSPENPDNILCSQCFEEERNSAK